MAQESRVKPIRLVPDGNIFICERIIPSEQRTTFNSRLYSSIVSEPDETVIDTTTVYALKCPGFNWSRRVAQIRQCKWHPCFPAAGWASCHRLFTGHDETP